MQRSYFLLQIDIAGSIIGSQSGDMVAIDNIVLMDGACPASVPSPCEYFCNACPKQRSDDAGIS